MQHRHTTDVWNLAQRIAAQVNGFETDEIAQLVHGLCSQHNPVVGQVQLGQRLHAAYSGGQSGQPIVVHVQGAQSWKMIEKPGVGIGQSGIGQLQPGDMLEICLQPGHGFQMPPHRHVAQIKAPSTRVALGIEIAGAAALPAASDSPVDIVARLPL
ncbi:hypothetical protein D3C84_943610 [compost metagenome]